MGFFLHIHLIYTQDYFLIKTKENKRKEKKKSPKIQEIHKKQNKKQIDCKGNVSHKNVKGLTHHNLYKPAIKKEYIKYYNNTC